MNIDSKTNIDKRTFWRYVNSKVDRNIHSAHILSVINILFEEIISDLKAGKEIKMFNFGSLSLVKVLPRMYHDLRYHKMMYSAGNKKLSFKISKKIRDQIIKKLDLDKTFGDIK